MTSISELEAIFERQKQAYFDHPNPSLDERAQWLDSISGALMMNRERVAEALREDFSVHPNAQSDFIEVLGVVARLAYAKSMLPVWLADDTRELDQESFGKSHAFVRPQPKGVIGNMVPWNFPFDLSIGPLAEMLAGGNRVIIKPSDMTPACGRVLKEIIGSVLPEEVVAVVPGDVDLAKHFPKLAWDHLLYTGNPEIGRYVAREAAENLVPLTLELGGKCPAIFDAASINRETVSSMLRVKMIKNGQVCVSPDYALVPEDRIDDVVRHARDFVEEAMPNYADCDQITGIINDRHVSRIETLSEDAAKRGAEVVTLGARSETNARRIPLKLVLNPDPQSRVMKEEIFGPILPILTYNTIEDAIHYVASRERPLGIYVYTDDPVTKENILSLTQSGGVTFNACAAHAGQPNMGFGGSGRSGYGRHHGIEGFREFTNPRAILDFDLSSSAMDIAPPYGAAADALLKTILGGDQ